MRTLIACAGAACLVLTLAASARPDQLQLTVCAGDGTELDDLSPECIQKFLKNKKNSKVTSAAKFLERLQASAQGQRDEYGRHWIMMSRTESSQKATAKAPRFILPSKDSRKVFAFESRQSGAHPDNVEYIYFEDRNNIVDEQGKSLKNTFRFFEIQVSKQNVEPDDKDGNNCGVCHHGRPNWDAYDSWAGMLPFNRDRVYVHTPPEEEFAEEKAIKRVFRSVGNDPVAGQLPLPDGITCNGKAGNISICYDKTGTLPIQITPGGTPDPVGNVDVAFDVDKNLPSYPGPFVDLTVTQGGNYLVLGPGPGTDADEGRGVALFDQLTLLNAKRVAQELLDHDRSVVDIRPVALAIAKGCTDPSPEDDQQRYAPQDVLATLREYHEKSKIVTDLLKVNNRFEETDKHIEGFSDLVVDTGNRRASLPRAKANLQVRNVRGLMEANGDEPTIEAITQEVFRRSPQVFRPDKVTECTYPDPRGGDGCIVDREFDGVDGPGTRTFSNTKIALFRFFLEPSKVRVGRWSMSVKDRSLTYTFGDQLGGGIDKYLKEIKETLKAALGTEDCPTLAAQSLKSFQAVIDNDRLDYFRP